VRVVGRFLDFFLVAVIVSFMCLGMLRALALYARGVRVVAVDRARTVVQGLSDLGMVAAFVTWIYEALAFAWPLRRHLVPGAMQVVILDSFGLRVLGALTMAAGLGVWLAAMSAMGASWRVGIDRDAPGALVTRGIFARTRNPIYVAFDLLVIGTLLMEGRLVFLIAALVLGSLGHLLIRREERFLAQVHGAAYERYRARVGRYFTI